MKAFTRVRYTGEKTISLGQHGEITTGSEMSLTHQEVTYMKRTKAGFPNYLEVLGESDAYEAKVVKREPTPKGVDRTPETVLAEQTKREDKELTVAEADALRVTRELVGKRKGELVAKAMDYDFNIPVEIVDGNLDELERYVEIVVTGRGTKQEADARRKEDAESRENLITHAEAIGVVLPENVDDLNNEQITEVIEDFAVLQERQEVLAKLEEAGIEAPETLTAMSNEDILRLIANVEVDKERMVILHNLKEAGVEIPEDIADLDNEALLALMPVDLNKDIPPYTEWSRDELKAELTTRKIEFNPRAPGLKGFISLLEKDDVKDQG